jgi:hypothetical protein
MFLTASSSPDSVYTSRCQPPFANAHRRFLVREVHLGETRSIQSVVPDDSLFSLRLRLEVHRNRAESLIRKGRTLQSRGRRLAVKAGSLCNQLSQCGAALSNSCARSTTMRIRLALRPRPIRIPAALPSATTETLGEVVESPDLLAALADAVEILKLEFADTEGSGRRTLATKDAPQE